MKTVRGGGISLGGGDREGRRVSMGGKGGMGAWLLGLKEEPRRRFDKWADGQVGVVRRTTFMNL